MEEASKQETKETKELRSFEEKLRQWETGRKKSFFNISHSPITFPLTFDRLLAVLMNVGQCDEEDPKNTPLLQSFVCSGCRIPPPCLDVLKPYFLSPFSFSLRHVDLSFNRLQNEGTRELLSLLSERWNMIQEGIKHPSSCGLSGRHVNPLTSLNLSANGISKEGFQFLEKSLRKLPISVLRIGYNHPSPEDISLLILSTLKREHKQCEEDEQVSPLTLSSSSSSTTYSLRVLDLEHSELTPQSAISISSVTSAHPFSSTLCVLNLQDNKIGSKGFESIVSSSLLCGVSNLQSLNVQNNGIRYVGVEVFCDLLKKGFVSPSLCELILDTNEITDIGAALLAEAIDAEKNIFKEKHLQQRCWQCLSLQFTSITDVGAEALLSVVLEKKEELITPSSSLGDDQENKKSPPLIPPHLKDKVSKLMEENESLYFLYEWLTSLLARHGDSSLGGDSSPRPLVIESLLLTGNQLSEEVFKHMRQITSRVNLSFTSSVPKLVSLCLEWLVNYDSDQLDLLLSSPDKLPCDLKSFFFGYRERKKKCSFCDKQLFRKTAHLAQSVIQNSFCFPMGADLIASWTCSHACRQAVISTS